MKDMNKIYIRKFEGKEAVELLFSLTCLFLRAFVWFFLLLLLHFLFFFSKKKNKKSGALENFESSVLSLSPSPSYIQVTRVSGFDATGDERLLSHLLSLSLSPSHSLTLPGLFALVTIEF